ncbi:MAG: hypothetical protein WCB91_00480 [Halobacteriota archaeon]
MSERCSDREGQQIKILAVRRMRWHAGEWEGMLERGYFDEIAHVK